MTSKQEIIISKQDEKCFLRWQDLCKRNDINVNMVNSTMTFDDEDGLDLAGALWIETVIKILGKNRDLTTYRQSDAYKKIYNTVSEVLQWAFPYVTEQFVVQREFNDHSLDWAFSTHNEQIIETIIKCYTYEPVIIFTLLDKGVRYAKLYIDNNPGTDKQLGILDVLISKINNGTAIYASGNIVTIHPDASMSFAEDRYCHMKSACEVIRQGKEYMIEKCQGDEELLRLIRDSNINWN